MTTCTHVLPAWDTSLKADGPLIVAWLEHTNEYQRIGVLNPNWQSRMSQWRRGVPADFWCLDRILTGLGLHPTMLPDEVWL